MPCWVVEEAMHADRQLAVYTQQKTLHHTYSHCAHNLPETELEVNYQAAREARVRYAREHLHRGKRPR